MASHINFNGQLVDIDESLRELDRWDCEESLAYFLRDGWRYIDPAPFVDGWVIDALSEHLQAVCDGEIRKLLINLPPRSLKSTLCSTVFPAWVWAQRNVSHTSGPGCKFLHASYADRLSLRDSVRCRRLIESPWYQERWSARFALSRDQNAKHRFSNDKGGERLITSVGAGVTGEGYDIGMWDDVNAANEVESEASIEEVVEWWDGVMSTRMNDPKRSAWVGVQQRLNERDWSGHLLSKNDGDIVHLCLPMRYEWERHTVTVIGWNDPRGCDEAGEPLVLVDDVGRRYPRNTAAATELKSREGSLLWPERFGYAEVESLERELGPWRASGQLQQRPSPKGGGIIKREWWQAWEGEFPPFSYILATLDTAYTEKQENDPSGMAVWGVFNHDVVSKYHDNVLGPTDRNYTMQSPRVMLIDAWNDRLDLHALVNRVAKTCKLRKVDKLLIENKASGISVAQEMRRLFGNENWAVQLFDPKSQDKMARLYSIQHIFAESMVYAPDREYAEAVIGQCEVFPKGRHDEQVDNTSSALRHLRDMGLLQRPPEVQQDIEDDMRHDMQRTPRPLYPA